MQHTVILKFVDWLQSRPKCVTFMTVFIAKKTGFGAEVGTLPSSSGVRSVFCFRSANLAAGVLCGIRLGDCDLHVTFHKFQVRSASSVWCCHNASSSLLAMMSLYVPIVFFVFFCGCEAVIVTLLMYANKFSANLTYLAFIRVLVLLCFFFILMREQINEVFEPIASHCPHQ